jgi:hypothetical protein
MLKSLYNNGFMERDEYEERRKKINSNIWAVEENHRVLYWKCRIFLLYSIMSEAAC